MIQSRVLRYRESHVCRASIRLMSNTDIFRSCTQDTKHAAHNTIPAPDQALARRRRSSARAATTSSRTARNYIKTQHATAASPEHFRVDTAHALRSHAGPFDTACIVFPQSRLRQRRCASLNRPLDACAVEPCGTRGSSLRPAAVIRCQPCRAVACGRATAETVL
jgi:hypothetical protein